MAASRANYIAVYKNNSQVYSASSLSTIANTPLPKGVKQEDVNILFITFQPDTQELCVFRVPEDEIEEAKKEAEEKKTKKKTKENGEA